MELVLDQVCMQTFTARMSESIVVHVGVLKVLNLQYSEKIAINVNEIFSYNYN